MSECKNDYCMERFENIEKRLEVGEKRMNGKSEIIDKHGVDIEVIKTNTAHLTKSMDALTKALWGVAATTMATLLSFFVWYIQNK